MNSHTDEDTEKAISLLQSAEEKYEQVGLDSGRTILGHTHVAVALNLLWSQQTDNPV
jgi:hypothetical protein